MNPWLIALIVVAVLIAAATAYVLLTPNPEVGNAAKLEIEHSDANRELLETVVVFPAELAAATGKDGAACWIAVDGAVYDLSGFDAWKDGTHHGIECGTDATDGFVKSPHARRTLESMSVVGRLGA